jgi:hypothetical protein
MIEQRIIDKILRGERVRMFVSGKDNAVDTFRSWLQEFRYSCGYKQFINCNSIVSLSGSERLDVEIGVIPCDRREFFVGILSKNRALDSPLVIIEFRESIIRY